MAESTVAVGAAQKEKKHLPFLLEVLARMVKEKPLGTLGGGIVIVLFLVGIFAPLLAPYHYTFQDLNAILSPPSGRFLLGTDNLGRDLLSRIIYGARISMIVGLSVPAISTVLHLLIGGVSAYLGGKVDLMVQRFVDTVMCFPGLVLMLTVVAIVGPGLTPAHSVAGDIGRTRRR